MGTGRGRGRRRGTVGMGGSRGGANAVLVGRWLLVVGCGLCTCRDRSSVTGDWSLVADSLALLMIDD